LDSLINSSRIFQKLELLYGCGDYLTSPEKFELLEESISFTRSDIKQLKISYLKVAPSIIQSLLNLLPNLESVELKGVSVGEQTVKLDHKSRKIERILIKECIGAACLHESLERCTNKELEFDYWSESESEFVRKFLKVQEKNLKKIVGEMSLDLLVDLKNLRLEHFEYYGRSSGLLELLQKQVDLRFLRLSVGESHDRILNVICELKSLECLELSSYREMDSRNLNNLHQLKILRRLKVDQYVSRNILDHMKFGVFEDLEELDAYFQDASVDSLLDVKKFAPNLKKIQISLASSDTINSLLENLENLESVKINGSVAWDLPPNKVYPKLKHLHIAHLFARRISAERLTEMFPNLEYFRVFRFLDKFESAQSLHTLLKGMKRLKKLRLDDVHEQGFNSNILAPEFVLQCVRDGGKKLKEIEVGDDQRGLRRLKKFAPGFEKWVFAGCMVYQETFFLYFSS
jgi:hypothetical protein